MITRHLLMSEGFPHTYLCLGLGALAVGVGDAIFGAGTVEGLLGFGAADAAAGAAGVGAIGATDAGLAAGTGGALALDAVPAATAGAGAAGVGAATDAFAGIAPGISFGAAAPITDASGVVASDFSALGAADSGATALPGTTGYAAFPGYSPITPGTPGFSATSAVTGDTTLGTLPGVGGASSYAPVTGDTALATLPGGGAGGGAGGAGTSLDALAPGGLPATQGPMSLTPAAAPADTGGVTGILKSLGVTPIQAAGAAVAGGGLLYNLFGQKPLPEATALQGQIGQVNSLLQNFQAGNLPAGYKAAIDSATAAAKANIISNYASRGLPTDPTKNSALAQEIASAERNAVILTAQVGDQLLKGGLDAVGMETNIYETLLKLDQQQSAQTGAAIASFASALSGGMRPAQPVARAA